jgi:transposase
MAASTDATRGRKLTVERVAPALALLARGAFAREAAEPSGVSIATVLNWMDWASKHHAEVEAHLREFYPHLSEQDLAFLWERIERRRLKRRHRRDFGDWRLAE